MGKDGMGGCFGGYPSEKKRSSGISKEEHARIVKEECVKVLERAAKYANQYWGDAVEQGLKEMAKNLRDGDGKI